MIREAHVRTRAISLLGLVLAVVLLVGCGGKSGTTASDSATSKTSTAGATTTSGTAPHAGFVASADAVCGRINTEILAIKSHRATAAEVKRVVPLTISIERKAIDQLAALHPPPAVAADWQRMLGYRRTLVSQLGQLLALAKRNDGTSLKPLVASKKRVHNELSKTGTQAGFKDCSKIGGVG